MLCSALFITDHDGNPIISKSYRGDIPLTVVDKFKHKVSERDVGEPLFPIFTVDDEHHFVFIAHTNLYLAVVTRRNSDCASIFVFLHKLAHILESYFGELEEESIRDNFVLVYEILDEVMDFGYPQVTDSAILQEFILNESHRLVHDVLPPSTVTNVVSWRSPGIKHRRNEAFLDVIEKVNCLVSRSGQVLTSEILGVLRMKTFLSGMPELKLGLNDRVLFDANRRNTKGRTVDMEDIRFHQCVRLAKFDNDRTISFIPPDGEFELMSYRLNTHVKPLFWIDSHVVPHAGSRIEYTIKVRSQYKRRSTANNVQLEIPVPNDADSPSFKATHGSVEYIPERDVIVWSIRQYPGQKEFILRAQLKLPSIYVEPPEAKRAPIAIKFEIPYFTVSGIQVRYLKVTEKSGYHALPWVRYITKNGNYQTRIF